MPDRERLIYLLSQASLRRATNAEYEELLELIHADDSGEINEQIEAFHLSRASASGNEIPYNPALWQETVQEILAADKPTRRRIVPLSWKWAAAACILIIAAGAWFMRQQPAKPAVTAVNPPDVAPGGNKAVLTLADGSQITLDSAGNGVLAQQGGSRVTKLANGQLAYDNSGTSPEKILYNTMTTPRGGQYKLLLPDGTTVWLNAGSSITYPTGFTGKERNVSITGEAYFEVSRNEKMPFRVTANNTTIEVLGTHFNINAYKDEASINTTLLEGSVRVLAYDRDLLLRPGQQAKVDRARAGIEVKDHVNAADVIAWKEGYFSFNDADLPTVMRQLARWYDVEVTYEGKIPDRVFTGEIGRGLTLTQVLKGLSTTRIKYRIENGRRIIIQP